MSDCPRKRSFPGPSPHLDVRRRATGMAPWRVLGTISYGGSRTSHLRLGTSENRAMLEDKAGSTRRGIDPRRARAAAASRTSVVPRVSGPPTVTNKSADAGGRFTATDDEGGTEMSQYAQIHDQLLAKQADASGRPASREPHRRPERGFARTGPGARECRGRRRARQRGAHRDQQDREGARSDQERNVRDLRGLRRDDSDGAAHGSPVRRSLHPLRHRRGVGTQTPLARPR